MTEILGAATTATKVFLEVNQISIDNWTFKLFYKATTSLLLGCSVIASSKQFFGDPINCEVVKRKSLLRMIKVLSYKRPYKQLDCFTINHKTVVLSFNT
jgi:hypothetical protein